MIAAPLCIGSGGCVAAAAPSPTPASSASKRAISAARSAMAARSGRRDSSGKGRPVRDGAGGGTQANNLTQLGMIKRVGQGRRTVLIEGASVAGR